MYPGPFGIASDIPGSSVMMGALGPSELDGGTLDIVGAASEGELPTISSCARNLAALRVAAAVLVASSQLDEGLVPISPPPAGVFIWPSLDAMPMATPIAMATSTGSLPSGSRRTTGLFAE